MRLMKGLTRYSLLCLAVLFFIAPARAQTGKPTEPTPPGDGQLLRALLDEVRQLRLAIERSNLSTFRVQIAIERMRFQQGRVDSVARDLENLRLQLSSMKVSRAQSESRLKDLEDQMTDETETTRKAQLERQYKEAKRNMDVQVKWEEQTRERETQLSVRLQEEQGKLSEINNRIDTLERQLEQEQYEDKPRKEKTRP
jgi:predicted  nucleic acid-binding Zn-ribbon protein